MKEKSPRAPDTSQGLPWWCCQGHIGFLKPRSARRTSNKDQVTITQFGFNWEKNLIDFSLQIASIMDLRT